MRFAGMGREGSSRRLALIQCGAVLIPGIEIEKGQLPVFDPKRSNHCGASKVR